MVFESLVVELLNKFLGDYVENLDASQLKLGIFGGDVTLGSLDIKPTALDDLDLPVKLKSGYLGKLNLKIPWRNLYKEAVVAEIDGLYILVVPNKGVGYNAEKEEKYTMEAKQKELSAIDEARKARKKKLEENGDAQPPADTFAEKMATQIIRNLQVTVKNIHVRFEDEYNNRERPFAAGLTLDSLYFQTTDESWNPCIVTEAIDQVIYKLVDLNNASVYWNSGCELMSHLKEKNDIRDRMKAQIATSVQTPSDYNYVLKPINLAAHLRLIQKPERDTPKFSRHKIDLTVKIPDIGLHIGKFQYQDILLFLEALERMNVSALYKKYRPDLKDYRGHYKEWWQFAYSSILEEQIRRKHRNWSWDHMKQHRSLVKRYTEAWIDKKTKSSPPKSSTVSIAEAEKLLDVFNLNVARQQAELEIDKRELVRLEDQQTWGQWAASWLGYGTKKKEDSANLADQWSEAMDDNEKKKLYEALDYQEGQIPVDMPPEFVAVNMVVRLETLSVAVEDDLADRLKLTVLTLALTGVGLSVQQRPGADALNANVKMETFGVRGMAEKEAAGASLVTMSSPDATQNVNSPKDDLLTVLFETHPLDKSCDQKIRIHTHPINVIYHAATINKLAEVFRPPESVALKQLTATAMAKYDDIKERSATGLEFALEKRTVMHLDIDVQPTRVIVPELGVYTKGASLLVLNLGSLKIKTEGIGKQDIDSVAGKTEAERYEKLLKLAYDNFRVELSSLQMVFAGPTDDWQWALKQKTTSMHVLQPTGLSILMQRCTIEDIKMPKLRLSGVLPDLSISLTNERVTELLKLALSIPTPPPAPAPKSSIALIEEPSVVDRAKLKTIMEVQDTDISTAEEGPKTNEKEAKPATPAQQTALELDLSLKKISIALSREVDGKDIPGLAVEIASLACKIQQRAYDMHLVASLGNIEVRHDEYRAVGKDGPLCLVENPNKMMKDKPLISVDILQADRKGPDFLAQYNLTEMKLTTRIALLHIFLHQEALMDIQKMLNNLTAELAKIQKEKAASLPTPPTAESKQYSDAHKSRHNKNLLRPASLNRSRSASRESRSPSQKSVQRLTSRVGKPGRRGGKDGKADPNLEERIINTKIEADLGEILIAMGKTEQAISAISVRGIRADLAMRKSQMQLSAVLKELGITDSDPQARHKQILAVEGENVFALDFTQFQRTEEERVKMTATDVDMAVELRFNRLRFIFLNLWLSKMQGWAQPFQAAAAEAASQAGSAAADNATAAAQEFYQAAAKIRLDVSITAPLIVIPKNSNSNDTLLVDLGNVCLKNQFTSESVAESNVPAVCEQLSVSLTQVRVARGLLHPPGSKEVVLAECRIVEPITFDLNIQRNLSFDWYKAKPEIAVDGKLPTIELGMSQEDYATIMAVLSGNLAEGSDTTPQAAPVTATAKKEIGSEIVKKKQPNINDSDKEKLAVAADTHAAAPKEPQSSEAAKKPRLTFNFKLEGIEAVLYMGSSNLTKGVSERDRHRALGCTRIITLDIHGHILVDTSLNAEVSLLNFTLDDLRPGMETSINRLMDKKIDKQPDGNPSNFLDIKVVQHSNQDQFIDMKLRSFFLCVNAEFLAAIAVFFTPPSSDEEIHPKKTSTDRSKPVPKKQASPSVVERRKAVFDLSVTVEQPEFMIVEDATHPDDTKALILWFKFSAKMKNSPDQDVLQASMDGLEMFSSYFKPEKRGQYHVPVLQPLYISVIGNKPYGQGLRMDVSVSDFVIKISASVVQLLSGVGTKFTEMQAATHEEMAGKKQRTKRNLWVAKSVYDGSLPFINAAIEAAKEAEEEEDPVLEVEEILTPGAEMEEQLMFKLDTLILTVEGGIGSKTVPLIFLEAGMHAEVQNWSSKLSANGALTLEVAYYNEKFCAWEPMVEPVEDNSSYRPWELQFTAQRCSEFDVEDAEATFQAPEMAMAIISTDMLQLTMTKSSFDCVSKLGEVFGNAAKQTLPAVDESMLSDAPYVVVNDTGFDVIVMPTDSLKFLEFDDECEREGVPIETGGFVGMKPVVVPGSARQKSHLRAMHASSSAYLMLKFPDMQQTVREVDVSRAEERYFPLPKVTHPGDTWGLVVDVTTQFGHKTVYLRSPVQVQNHLDVEIEIYFPVDNNLELCGRAAPGKIVDIPLPSMYTPTGELFFKPADDGYDVSGDAVDWRKFDVNLTSSTTLNCASIENPDRRFYLEVFGELVKACFENTSRTNITSQTYKIHLRPSVTFNNMLPLPLIVSPPDTEPWQLSSGEGSPLYAICPDLNAFKVETEDFAGKKYTCMMKVERDQDDLVPRTFLADDGKKKDFALHTLTKHGSKEVTLFCPFWMVNKTGRAISYKEFEGGLSKSASGKLCCSSKTLSDPEFENAQEEDGVTLHPADFDKPVMLSFKGKSMFGPKKAVLRVEDSLWSDKFPLDVVGSSGRVSCKAKDGRTMEVCVRITLSHSGLTKIVTFTPFYLLDNRCRDSIMVRECNSDYGIEWVMLPAKECSPFWPRQTDPKKMQLCAKYEGSDEETQDFSYTETYEVLLKLDSPYHVGMYMNCSVADHAVIVTMEDYAEGQASALLVNAMVDHIVYFGQAEVNAQEPLEPNTYRMFSWTSLTKKRELVWSCGDRKNHKELLFKDSISEFCPKKSGPMHYAVCLLSKGQRVVLFTGDLAMASIAQQAFEIERIANQITLSLQGIGLSLVNNLIRKELLYFSITSSGIVWESKKGKRFKPLTCKENVALETAFVKWENGCATGEAQNDRVILDKMDIDFSNMHMHKPHDRDIKRSFQTGLWVQLKNSEHAIHFHAKIQKMQLDNQLPACVFPTVFSVVPPAKSVAADSIPKPFVEISLVMRLAEVSQIRYFKMLIQEMDVKADQGFIYAVLGVFAAEDPESVAGVDLHNKDMALTRSTLKDIAMATTSTEEKKYFENLHFSPIMVHLSFSQGGSSGDDSSGAKSVPLPTTFFSLLLKSVGVTVTELQDVVFKLAYFERMNVMRNQQQLTAEVIDHYTKQAIKQFYVLVLGLDVIGNPFGLMRNLGDGVQDFFYEPIQGAIQGPEEFAEGLALGVRSLFGHAIGGAAGAVGRITGTLGKGIAALTMDEDYQRKRQEAINRRPKNFQEGMARSGKGLVTGVFDGVTGVFLKPVEGAKQDGAAGFAKGVGKGLIGLVTRPAAGVVDFASGSLDAVRRVADVGEEVKQIRTPRYLHPDFIVRPYSSAEAAGNAILQSVAKGKYVATDAYFAHAPVTKDKNYMFLATDHRVMLVSRGNILGQWNCDWSYTWDEMAREPSLTSKGLQFVLREPKKKKLGFIGSSSAGKVVPFVDKSISEYITSKVVEAYRNANL